MDYDSNQVENLVSLNHKKNNRLVYKCTHCKRVDHLEPFCFENLKRSKGNVPRPHGKTNAPGPKKILVPKVKP